MVGLGVVGGSLELNMADHGFSVAGYDKGPDQVEAPRKESADRNICGAENINNFIAPLRLRVRAQTGVATTTGYGPRFLHSTGQLHKGGPDSGVFLQIIAADTQDVNIPGQPFTFGVLK